MLLALCVAAPAMLLGALANLVVLSELVALDVWPSVGQGEASWDRLLAFKQHVEVLLVGLFLVLSLVTLVVLFFAPDVLVGLNLWAAGLVGLFSFTVLAELSLGGASAASARIGMGAALWGTAWVLVGLHVLLFLRPLRRHHWVWVAMGMAGAFAGLSLFVLVLGWLVPVEIVSLFVFLLAAAAAFVVVFTRHEIARELEPVVLSRRLEGSWSGTKGLPWFAGYTVLVAALVGASYQHHFDYRPSAEVGHFVLMGAAFLVAVPLWGLLARNQGRRRFLLSAPLVAFVPTILLLVQQQHNVMGLVAVSQGLMLGLVPFVLLVLVEGFTRVTRGVAFVCCLGIVVVMGAGGSVVAQLSGAQGLTPDLLLSLQFAMFFTAMLLAMGLPEQVVPDQVEEELEEYLEIAKRVSRESR